ncbi:hypothetical protein [Halopiger xanaduensis]|uniref:DUF8131 domain-containing protein n=1 Tax=Halopiger xanaduensis (strain DSM 18323 / JCM 14033 / SH-6) TaxID=797210 RepID=F8D7M5_HALXS|nr:hypothetical protein [Halopiger xanaduensis]AEH36567.1 hypothetical protein Halxa_1940 [Halopiger xanaduensis SH-6]
MTLETATPRRVAAVALLAIVPVFVYGSTHSAVAGLVSAINVLLIYGSLYVAFSPVEESHGHGHGPAEGNGTTG